MTRNILLPALVSGSFASIVTSAVLSLASVVEGRGALQPVNATSHWLHGSDAGRVRELDVTHTGVGFATHHASALFWAMLFEVMRPADRRQASPARTARDAALTSTIAAVVDYAVVPRRITPGWEHAVSKTSIALAYVALAAGLTAGGLISRNLR
jgi:hypothetical protein